MKLWRLQRDGGYDENHGFIIRAATEKEAREMAAQDAFDEGPAVWLDPAATTCERLMVAGEPGIILVDYLAG